MNRLRRKIGQMLVMGFPGSEVNEHSVVTDWIQQGALGGVLLFDYDFTKKQYGKNLISLQQIKRMTAKLTDLARAAMPDLPLLIGIDYEGGAVDRLAKIDGAPKTMSAAQQGVLTEDALYAEAMKMAVTLKSLGFNLNFAPVVDLNLNEQEGIIGRLERSFSSDPKRVSQAAWQWVKAFSEQKLICSYKHFPGHGSATGDTHEGFVDVTMSYSPEEIALYEPLIQKGVTPVMIMTAHVINRHLDASGTPATLSYPILTELLRKRMGFDGVIISDDLQMRAISEHYTLADALKRTINAGADMVIFGNQLGYHAAPDLIDCILQMVISGDIAEARIEEAYQRIVSLKQFLPLA